MNYLWIFEVRTYNLEMKSGSRPPLTNRASEGAWERIRRRDWIFWKDHSILLLEKLVSTLNNARASASSGRNTIEWKVQIRLSSQQWMKHLEISILPLLSSSAYINHWIHMILSIQFSRNCMYQSSTSSSISKSLKAFLISYFCSRVWVVFLICDLLVNQSRNLEGWCWRIVYHSVDLLALSFFWFQYQGNRFEVSSFKCCDFQFLIHLVSCISIRNSAHDTIQCTKSLTWYVIYLLKWHIVQLLWLYGHWIWLKPV
jgi:hypothetical protein